MTDENRKPEEDEVLEEELEDVAGGVTATGLDATQSQSKPPTDVCKAPPPPAAFVPTPYPVVTKPEDPKEPSE